MQHAGTRGGGLREGRHGSVASIINALRLGVAGCEVSSHVHSTSSRGAARASPPTTTKIGGGASLTHRASVAAHVEAAGRGDDGLLLLVLHLAELGFHVP